MFQLTQWNPKNLFVCSFLSDIRIFSMASKHELQQTMKTFGYDLNPFTSKETLVNLLRLHSKVRIQTKT